MSNQRERGAESCLVVTGNVHDQFSFVTMLYIEQPLYIKLVSLCIY